MASPNPNSALVSVIVPCYNQGKYLADALESILLQTYTEWECIVIDDGSTDNSKLVTENYVQKDKRFKYIYQENKGVAKARNNAIKISTGKYILPLDADDKISHDYIKDCVEVMESDKSVKLVYCKAETFGQRSAPWNLPEYSFKQLLIENLIFCSAIYRRDDLHEMNYDEQMSEGFEDWEFWISFLSETDKIVRLPKVHFYYRLKEQTRNPKTSDSEKQARIRNYIFLKHRELYQKYFPLPDIIFDYYKASTTLHSIQNSSSYRIGKVLLKPYWYLKRLFK
jgi:glycosyltransferase involved in cell wall biosynthesis